MKTILLFALSSLISCPLFASTAEEIQNIIRCHDALNGKSDGISDPLRSEHTPIALVFGKKVYFMTSDSILALDKTPSSDLVVRLKDKNEVLNYKLSFDGHGALGSAGTFFAPGDLQKAQEPHVALDDNSLNIFKAELARRLKNVTEQYQNKYDPADTIKSLHACESIDFSTLKETSQKALATQGPLALQKDLEFYQKLQKNKKLGSGQGYQ